VGGHIIKEGQGIRKRRKRVAWWVVTNGEGRLKKQAEIRIRVIFSYDTSLMKRGTRPVVGKEGKKEEMGE